MIVSTCWGFVVGCSVNWGKCVEETVSIECFGLYNEDKVKSDCFVPIRSKFEKTGVKMTHIINFQFRARGLGLEHNDDRVHHLIGNGPKKRQATFPDSTRRGWSLVHSHTHYPRAYWGQETKACQLTWRCEVQRSHIGRWKLGLMGCWTPFPGMEREGSGNHKPPGRGRGQWRMRGARCEKTPPRGDTWTCTYRRLLGAKTANGLFQLLVHLLC